MSGAALLLHGGMVADGAPGVPLREADLLVRDGRIAAVEAPSAFDGTDAERVDCTGHLVAPGFVDIHTHSDLTRLVYPRAESRVRQGVTTEVIGNCGLSPAPVGDDDGPLRATIGPVDLVPDVQFSWRTVDEFLARIDAAPSCVNTVPLVGHGAIRHAVLGDRTEPADAGALATMRALVDAALDSGVWGLSFGLMYAPGESAAAEELQELARTTTARNGLVAAHLRAYDGERLLDALDEFLRFAGAPATRLQISHLRSIGAGSRGVPARALARIEVAREAGVDVAADAYPYTAGHTTILQLLPPDLRAAGTPRILAAVRDDAAAAARAMSACGFPPGAVTIVRTGDARTDACGRRLDELGGWDAAVALVDRFNGAVDVIVEGAHPDDVRETLVHREVVIASDGATLDTEHRCNVPHPRSFGTFPRAIGVLRDAGVPLADAIAKATGAPAARIGLTGRGLLRSGAVADVVVLDPDALADRATYTDPLQPAAGVRDVVVAGEPVLRDGAYTDRRPGRLLTSPTR